MGKGVWVKGRGKLEAVEVGARVKLQDIRANGKIGARGKG